MGGTADAHRQDGGAGFCSDKARPFVDFHQAGGAGDATLGEDHDRFPRFDQADDFLDTQRAGVIDGEVRDPPQEHAKPAVSQYFGVHHEGDAERQVQAD